jgi:hypothetical protein
LLIVVLAAMLALLLIYLWLYSPCGNLPLFQFHNLYTVGRTAWMGDQPVARPLPTHKTTQTQNKRTETPMPWAGLDPIIPVFERAETVHVVDRAATVTGIIAFRIYEYKRSQDSSVSTATGWTTGVRFPPGARAFSVLHNIQTDSGVHPASYLIGAWGFFFGGKTTRTWSWPLTTSVKVKNDGAIPPLPHTS